MFKSILSLLLLWPLVTHPIPSAKANPLSLVLTECPAATSLRVTDQTTSTLGLAWNATGEPTLFKVWYVRQNDGFTSGNFFTSSTNFQVTSLSPGCYDFYVVAICSTGTAPSIGIEDIVIG